jgi:hypothetical protein
MSGSLEFQKVMIHGHAGLKLALTLTVAPKDPSLASFMVVPYSEYSRCERFTVIKVSVGYMSKR